MIASYLSIWGRDEVNNAPGTCVCAWEDSGVVKGPYFRFSSSTNTFNLSLFVLLMAYLILSPYSHSSFQYLDAIHEWYKHNFHHCNSHPLWSTVDTKSYWWKTSRSSLLPRFCFRLARLTLWRPFWDRPRWIVGKVDGRWISSPSKRISCPLSFRFMIYRTVHLPWTDDYHTSLFWLFSDFLSWHLISRS